MAGSLIPNPVVDGRRLDSALGNGFAVITSSAPSPHERAVIEGRGAALHVATPGSELAHWLHRGRATAVVVRPDRTVMRAGRNLRPLCDALPHFPAVSA